MDMTGEYRIAAPRQKVWDALNDPEILKQAIPGCESITKLSDTEMTATVRAKVGPVSARFGGKVTISDRDSPNGYRISGEGTGGPAGFAKGGATVRLADDDNGATKLSYVVEANVGGKLAQIGSRLIDATARQMADNFFAKFAQLVGGPAPAQTPAPSAAAAPASEPPPSTAAERPSSPSASVETPAPPTRTPPETSSSSAGTRLSPAIWVTGLAVIVIALLYFFTR